MKAGRAWFVAAGLGLAALVSAPSLAWAQAAKGPAAMLPGAGSHEPISINAGKLDYYDKEQKLVYTGDVVAVQGDSTLKASQLVILLTKTDPKGTGAGASAPATAGAPAAPGANSSVRHMDAVGPVTLISKDQIGTGDAGSYDRDDNKVTLSGNVTLSQGPNVTRGDRLVYDLSNGQAQVFSGKTTGRVSSIFTPGSQDPTQPGGPAPAKAAPGKAPPPPKKKTAPPTP